MKGEQAKGKEGERERSGGTKVKGKGEVGRRKGEGERRKEEEGCERKKRHYDQRGNGRNNRKQSLSSQTNIVRAPTLVTKGLTSNDI